MEGQRRDIIPRLGYAGLALVRPDNQYRLVLQVSSELGRGKALLVDPGIFVRDAERGMGPHLKALVLALGRRF